MVVVVVVVVEKKFIRKTHRNKGPYLALFACGYPVPTFSGHTAVHRPRRREQRPDTRALGARHYVESFYRENQSPIWSLLDTLKSPAGRLHIEAALIESQVSVDEFTTWAPAIIHNMPPSDEKADVAEQSPPTKPIPSWVVLYLVIYKVRTTSHAEGPLVDLVYHHLDVASPEVQGPLLVLTAYHLARHNLLIPLRRVVETFLTTPLTDQERQFNLFLQALSSTPFRSVEGANNVVSLLKSMEARQLKLRSQTYQALLNDRFVTLQLTKYLHDKMIQEGSIPVSCNTLMLNAHDDKASAFAFLRRLAQLSALHPKLLSDHRQRRWLHHDVRSASSLGQRMTCMIRPPHFMLPQRPLDLYPQAYPAFLKMTPNPPSQHIQSLKKPKYSGQSSPTSPTSLFKPGKIQPKPGQDPHIRPEGAPPPIPITTRISRPDIVFRLWDYMDVLYGVRPTPPRGSPPRWTTRSPAPSSRSSFSTRSRGARPARPLPADGTAVSPAARRAHAVRAITDALGTPTHAHAGLRAYRTSVWRQQLPRAFARTAFLRALFGMDPARRLEAVQPPPRPLGPRPYVFVPPVEGLRPPQGGSYYPGVVVTNANCFNYITLLGVGGPVGEIPLVLAWMRELGLQPSDSTLAVALVFWEEVSVQAPLVEKWSGGPERNEYARLVQWIKDWVGEKRMPDERTLQKWRGIVISMRKPAR
ncbi:hypothetical protein BJ912DRAFT_1024585 [Pholiota molesta]|nr:hypothetical protein BJ912DRAFT_1024585 [Pholiota molesta]